MSIPKGWLDYTPMGKQIKGTRFICFKVPLTTNLQSVDPDNKLTPQILVDRIPNLGLIIDLTDTYRYYNPNIFIEKGIEYKKIKVAGHILPPSRKHVEFAQAVTDFLSENADNERLIGVHCTHGCNRTGLMLCMFLVDHEKFSARKALRMFQLARGHDISRANYVRAIHVKEAANQPAPSDDVNDTTHCCQTDAGVWIGCNNFEQRQCANVVPGYRWRSGNDLLTIEVNPSDLIPDGLGNFVVRVAAASLPRTGGGIPYAQNNRRRNKW